MSESYKSDELNGFPNESSSERVLLRTSVGRALSGSGFGSVKVLSHEIAERVFTPKRREILSVLDSTDISSQRELARRVGRDPGAVQRDLKELIDADLVEVERDGRAKRPRLAFDTVVVEPLVAPDTVTDASYSVDSEP